MRMIVAVLLVLLLLPTLAFAQGGPGLLQIAPGTQLSMCTNIDSAVMNRTWCFDGNNNPNYTIKVWDGTQYVTILGGGGGGTITGSGTPNTLPLWTAATVLGDSILTQPLTNTIVMSAASSAQQTFTAGAAPGSVGASLLVKAGDATGPGLNGGSLSLFGGIPVGTGNGGGVAISGRQGNLGGNVTITGGNSTAGVGSSISLRPGTGSTTGGSLCLVGGNSTATQGGDVVLSGGGPTLGNVTIFGLRYPKVDGTNGQFMTTDGAGTLFFSSGPTVSNGFSGKTTICNTDTTASVVFSTPAGSAAYSVTLGTQPTSGPPPHVLADYNTPTVNGFQLSISQAPGAGNCVTVSWQAGGVTGGASATPGGPTGSIQFNNSGAFGGFGNWDGSIATIANVTTTGNVVVGTRSGTPDTLAAFDSTGKLVATSNAISAQRRVCTIIIGADNGAVLVDADLGPQGKQCFIPYAATIIEVTVAADGGTPSILPSKLVCGSAPCTTGTVTNLLSGALATAASGGVACSNTGGTTGIDGVTTCTNTLTTTSLGAGNYLELVSGTAGGVAKRMSIYVTYTVN